MCTSTESTFAWVGAIVVNTAFISFIAWGASTIWFLGFSISIVYTVVLFCLATILDKSCGGHETILDRGTEEEIDLGPENPETNGGGTDGTAFDNDWQGQAIGPPNDIQGRRSILVSLLYGLSVIALGVTGFFLPVNIFYCPDERPRPPKPGRRWDTNISSLPDEVQSWARSNEHTAIQTSFVYLPGSKTTLFSGTDGSYQRNILWAAMASVFPFRSAEPIAFPNTTVPTEFTLISDAKACFVSDREGKGGDGGGKDDPRPVPIRQKHIVACCDGKSVSVAHKNPDGITHQSPHDLFASNDILWYKDYPPAADQGSLVFSLDTSSYEETLHSTYRGNGQPGNDDDDDYYYPDDKWWECRRSVDRKRSILAIFVSALPVVVTSILLWAKKQIPTMGVTTYVGISALATLLYTSIDPEHENIDELNKWWYSVSGAIWLMILTDLFFSNHGSAPLTWGINFGSLCFLMGMIWLTDVFEQEDDCLWRWVVLNLVAFLPLAVLGIATDQILLLVLCALGFLMDSFRIAARLTENAGPDAAMPIFFVVLGTAGLGIAGFGWFLSRHQAELRSRLAGWLEEHSMSARLLRIDTLPTEDPLLEPILSSHHESDDEDGEQA